MIAIEDPSAEGAFESKALFISGATHCEAYLHITDRLPEWLSQNRREQPLRSFFKNGVTFYLVPIDNPDGYENRTRYNKNQKDLNRDFNIPGIVSNLFTKPETRSLAERLSQKILHNKKTLEVTIDYHCCNGSL